MYVCLYVCMYSLYVRACMCAYVCMCVCMCVWSACVHVCVRIVCVYVECLYVCVCVECLYVCVCVCEWSVCVYVCAECLCARVYAVCVPVPILSMGFCRSSRVMSSWESAGGVSSPVGQLISSVEPTHKTHTHTHTHTNTQTHTLTTLINIRLNNSYPIRITNYLDAISFCIIQCFILSLLFVYRFAFGIRCRTRVHLKTRADLLGADRSAKCRALCSLVLTHLHLGCLAMIIKRRRC